MMPLNENMTIRINHMKTSIATLLCLLTVTLLGGSSVHGQESRPLTPDFEGLAIFPGIEQTQNESVAGVKGVKIFGPRWLDLQAVRVIVAPYLGTPLSRPMLRAIQTNIVLLCRKEGHPVVDVSYPEVAIKEGVVPIAVVEGKLGAINVTGNKWWSTKWLKKQMKLKPGDPIKGAKLDAGLARLNENPDFRQVNAQFYQGTEVGEANINLTVNDRFPWRPHFEVNDGSQAIFGDNEVVGGLTWGKAFGLDETLDYQYATDFSGLLLKSHTANYTIPLPGSSTFSIFGNYSVLNPDLSILGFGPGFTEPSVYWQASARFDLPLWSIGQYKQDISVGYDHKRMSTAFLFTSLVLTNTPVAIDQFTFGYRGHLPDSWGVSSAGVRAYWSPGDLTKHNTDAAFDASKADTPAAYHYEVLEGERTTKLPLGFSHIVDVAWQFTHNRLPFSEQDEAGGYATVRGYDERLVLGDQGLIVRNELRAHPIDFWHFQDHQTISLQPLGFYDYGSIRVNNPQSGEVPLEKAYLESTGAGVRFAAAKHLTARLDWGYQLHRDEAILNEQGADRSRHRFHFAVDLAF
jgi:hemolysin activation/secretion protein